jgi:hypothetical protein
MAIRADSYGSVSEVQAYTRPLLDGQLGYNSTTRPSITEVEKFIDRASGVLNTAIAGAGLQSPILNSTAKLACDDWVVARATEYVELTQRGAGANDGENNRPAGFRNLFTSASKFVGEMRLGWVRMGVGQGHRMSEGLAYGGLDAQGQRTDPEDSTLEQPLFRRRLFDDNSGNDVEDE